MGWERAVIKAHGHVPPLLRGSTAKDVHHHRGVVLGLTLRPLKKRFEVGN